MLKEFAAMLLFVAAAATAAHTHDFSYHAPGKLQRSPTGKASGTGDPANRKIYAASIRLPIELANDENLYLNSQVYRPGGQHGGSGGQCHTGNYSMPWADTFCEVRSRSTLLCPAANGGHQGVDIRKPKCSGDYFAVAVEDGTIISTNRYTSSVLLKGNSGTTYIYLHLEPDTISVTPNQRVKVGEKFGKISNFMNGGRDTTLHLHFEMKQTVSYMGQPIFTHVPPYSTLVHANRERLGLPNMNNAGALAIDNAREK